MAVEIVSKRAETPVDMVNRRWMEGLQGRSKFEPILKRAYDQLISKAEKTNAGYSHYSLGLTASQVRAFTSQLFFNTVGDVPYQEWEMGKKDVFPIGLDDMEGLKNSEALVYHAHTDPDGGFLREWLQLIQMVLIYGIGFLKHTYECFYHPYEVPTPVYDEFGILKNYDFSRRQKVKLKTFEGIWYSVRSPFRVVVNPVAYNFARGRTGWVIDTETRVPIERLEELEKQNRIYNVDKIKENGWVDCFQHSNVAPEERALSENADQSKKGLVFIREYWDETNNEVVFVANWDVEIFRAKMPLLGGLPMTGFSLYNLPAELFSMGIPEQLKYVHNLADTWASLHVDELALRVHTPLFVKTGLGLRSKIHKVQPGDVVEVPGNPRDFAYPLERPSHQTEIFSSIAAFEDYGRKRTGLSQTIEGGAPQSNVTATASVGAATAQQSYLTFLTMLLSLDMGQMSKHNLMTLHQFMPVEGIRVREINSGSAPVSKDITYDRLNLNVVPRIKSENRSASRQDRINMLLAFFDRVAPFGRMSIDPKTMTITPGIVKLENLIARIAKEMQIPGWQDLLEGGVQQIPAELMQAFAQMQGQGALASPNQPQQVPSGQQPGNRLGQFASAASPNGNQFGDLPELDNILGIR